jgi:hypothetical protein
MLEILVIKGGAHQTTADDINKFLAGAPAKLHIIILTFSRSYDSDTLPRPWLPPLNILTLVPNLTLLGVKLDWFGREDAIQLYSEMKFSRKRLPNILISDFSVRSTPWLPFSVAHAVDIVRWWKLQSGSVDYITIDKSWEELALTTKSISHANLSSNKSSAAGLVVKSFFEELLKGDVRFCDSNGNMLGDSGSQELMLGVEKAGFRVTSSLQ